MVCNASRRSKSREMAHFIAACGRALKPDTDVVSNLHVIDLRLDIQIACDGMPHVAKAVVVLITPYNSLQ